MYFNIHKTLCTVYGSCVSSHKACKASLSSHKVCTSFLSLHSILSCTLRGSRTSFLSFLSSLSLHSILSCIPICTSSPSSRSTSSHPFRSTSSHPFRSTSSHPFRSTSSLPFHSIPSHTSDQGSSIDSNTSGPSSEDRKHECNSVQVHSSSRMTYT